MAMENELFRNLKQKPVTLQFPYEREEPVEGVRAKVSWNIDKCVGCLLCVRVCPGNAIEILGRGRKAEIKYILEDAYSAANAWMFVLLKLSIQLKSLNLSLIDEER